MGCEERGGGANGQCLPNVVRLERCLKMRCGIHLLHHHLINLRLLAHKSIRLEGLWGILLQLLPVPLQVARVSELWFCCPFTQSLLLTALKLDGVFDVAALRVFVVSFHG